jgi:hypothetical protein
MEIFRFIVTAVIAIGFVSILGLCIAEHFDILNPDEWY